MEKRQINLVGISIDVFQSPTNLELFFYSQTSVTAAIGKKNNDYHYYRTANPGEVDGKDFLFQIGRTRVSLLTDHNAVTYWDWKSGNGNKEAKALVKSIAIESLHRRALTAFGISKTEEEINTRSTQTRVEIFNAIAKEWEKLPEAQWNSVWRSSEKLQMMIEQYESMTDEERAQAGIPNGLELIDIGNGCIVARDKTTCHKENLSD